MRISIKLLILGVTCTGLLLAANAQTAGPRANSMNQGGLANGFSNNPLPGTLNAQSGSPNSGPVAPNLRPPGMPGQAVIPPVGRPAIPPVGTPPALPPSGIQPVLPPPSIQPVLPPQNIPQPELPPQTLEPAAPPNGIRPALTPQDIAPALPPQGISPALNSPTAPQPGTPDKNAPEMPPAPPR